MCGRWGTLVTQAQPKRAPPSGVPNAEAENPPRSQPERSEKRPTNWECVVTCVNPRWWQSRGVKGTQAGNKSWGRVRREMAKVCSHM